VGEEHRLDLGRVDVDAAGDDEVGAAVGEEQPAVVVEVADVAEGVPLALVGALGLALVLEVGEAADGGDLRKTVPAVLGGRSLPSSSRMRMWSSVTGLPTVPGFFSQSAT
jgi:hypothetical protein